MGDESFSDDMFPAAFDGPDDDIDRLIGDRLRQSFESSASTDDPFDTLASLQPRIVRARRVRRAGLAVSVLAPAAVLVGALMLVPGITSDGDGQATVAGQPEATGDAVADDGGVENRPTIEVTGTTAIDGDRPAGDGAPADEPAPDGSGSSTTPTPTAPTASTSPPTSRPATTEDRGASTSVPGSSIVESECGSIVIRVVDASVELLETRPDPGYDVDVKSPGPEVEVSFEGERGHCELRAEWERGRLVTSDGEDGEDDKSS